MAGIGESPFVSIVIATYNAKRYLTRSLPTALNQSYRSLEIIVVDDGSTDGTRDLVRSLADPRVRYLYQDNSGQGAARNHGIRTSTGEYVTFLDADDYYLPDKVEKQVRFLETHHEYDAVYCNALHFFTARPRRLYKRKGRFPSADIFPALLHGSLINLNTVMFRRKVLAAGFLFAESVKGRYSEEWDLYTRIARSGYHFGYLDADLVVVEVREGSNTTWDTQWIIKKNTLEMLEKLHADMSETQRAAYRMEEVLRANRRKLVVAYLISRQKQPATRLVRDVVSSGFVARLVVAVIRLIPAWVWRPVLIRLWILYQKSNFRRVDRPVQVGM